MADEPVVETQEDNIPETPQDDLGAQYEVDVPDTPVVDEPKVDPDGDEHSAGPVKEQGTDSDSDPVASPAPEIDAELRTLADAWGISRGAQDRLGEAALAKEVALLGARHAVESSRQPQRQDAPEREKTDLDKAIEAYERDPKGYDEDANGYDRSLVAEVKRQRDEIAYFRNEMEAQRHYVAEQNRVASEANMRQETDHWDDLFSEVDMDDLFGKGKYSELAPKSTEIENRFRVMEQVNVQNDLAQRRGEKVSDRELLLRACAVEFHNRLEKQVETQLATRVSERAKHSIARASTRRGVAKTPDQEAVEAVSSYMRDRGMAVDNIPADAYEF